jgi:hypothetical protein
MISPHKFHRKHDCHGVHDHEPQRRHVRHLQRSRGDRFDSEYFFHFSLFVSPNFPKTPPPTQIVASRVVRRLSNYLNPEVERFRCVSLIR